jgi:uncharacterized phage protein (TIGR01671 family)
MLEILFRGKRVDNGEWVYGTPIISGSGDRAFIATFKYTKDFKSIRIMDSFEVDPETVGQYTGLKDKSGNKIFEGDIVSGMVAIGFEMFKGEIVYDAGVFYIKCFKGGSDGYPIKIYNKCEIIGNIHDKEE